MNLDKKIMSKKKGIERITVLNYESSYVLRNPPKYQILSNATLMSKWPK